MWWPDWQVKGPDDIMMSLMMSWDKMLLQDREHDIIEDIS